MRGERHLLIRADAHIGTGRLLRCLALSISISRHQGPTGDRRLT